MAGYKEYAVCDFTIAGSGLDTVYSNGIILDSDMPTIIEFAAVRFTKYEVTGKWFHSYAQIDGVDPNTLTFEGRGFRGVTPNMLMGAPTLEKALGNFHEFTKSVPLVIRSEYPHGWMKNLRRAGKRYGIRFNNRVIRIPDIVNAADVIRQYYNLGEPDILAIAAKMRRDCEWKDIFAEYGIRLKYEDCLDYAVAFAELITGLVADIDLPF